MATSSSAQQQVKPSIDEPDLEAIYAASRRRAALIDRMYTLPWWLILIILIGISIAVLIATDDLYAGIFEDLQEGIGMTLGVSVVSYLGALMIALVVGLIRANPPKAPSPGVKLGKVIFAMFQAVAYNLATMYVQIMRGLPILIVLLVTAFVLVPLIRDEFINAVVVPFLRNLLNNPELPPLEWRGSSPTSAIVALAVTYGAYMSETVRAGIQSINKGQVEAAKSLGMTYFQTMRFVVLPQAFRTVLPPLGNDMVAMIKDSSLLAILGIRDITQVAKTSSGRTFRYLETYMTVAVIYLVMTIIGSLIVRSLEDTLSQDQPTPPWVLFIGRAYARLFGRKDGRKDVKLKEG